MNLKEVTVEVGITRSLPNYNSFNSKISLSAETDEKNVEKVTKELRDKATILLEETMKDVLNKLKIPVLTEKELKNYIGDKP